MKTVSIIVPVYNVRSYLHKCIDSLISQSYNNLEIILINDGSTDNSGAICDEYAQEDGRIKVIHQTNSGAANAKNTGLDLASGEYITFLDSDDYVEATWIENLINALESTGADIAECDFTKEYLNHSEPGNNETYIPGIYSGETYLGFYLSNWTCSLFWNKLFKSELTKDVRFRKERRCIDDEFYTYKVLSNAKTVVRIKDRLYHYRQRKSSVVSSEKNRKQITDDSLEILIERYQWISKRFPQLRKVYLKHDVEIMFYFVNNFDFTKKTAQKFRKIAAYYLLQSILAYSGKVPLLYALRLTIMPFKDLLQEKPIPITKDIMEYFQ